MSAKQCGRAVSVVLPAMPKCWPTRTSRGFDCNPARRAQRPLHEEIYVDHLGGQGTIKEPAAGVADWGEWGKTLGQEHAFNRR